jgi:hypothetical protein
MEHVLGKSIISDQPMSPEDWARERADVIDAEPGDFGDGREENHLALAKRLSDKASRTLPSKPIHGSKQR